MPRGQSDQPGNKKTKPGPFSGRFDKHTKHRKYSTTDHSADSHRPGRIQPQFRLLAFHCSIYHGLKIFTNRLDRITIRGTSRKENILKIYGRHLLMPGMKFLRPKTGPEPAPQDQFEFVWHDNDFERFRFTVIFDNTLSCALCFEKVYDFHFILSLHGSALLVLLCRRGITIIIRGSHTAINQNITTRNECAIRPHEKSPHGRHFVR